MVVREDLVASAISFLQDPSVAGSPLDKKIAFLQSKNLTQEEIDASLARAGDQPQQNANYGYQQPMQQMPPRQNYGYQPAGYWQQPPPELPRRDWRDYFIMATVMSGLGYGVYTIAKRYIVPLIAPPTPPQLEQDKAAIDEAFTRAFTLIDQLAADTAELKASEESRKERLDAALADVEAVIHDLKNASRRRDEEGRRITDEVNAVKALIPEAMKAQKESNDARLVELNSELKSLKTLVGNRLGGNSSAPRSALPNGASSYGETALPRSSLTAEKTGTNTDGEESKEGTDREHSRSPLPRVAGRSGIPPWQLAAAKKETEKKAASESGTAVDADAETAA